MCQRRKKAFFAFVSLLGAAGCGSESMETGAERNAARDAYGADYGEPGDGRAADAQETQGDSGGEVPDAGMEDAGPADHGWPTDRGGGLPDGGAKGDTGEQDGGHEPETDQDAGTVNNDGGGPPADAGPQNVVCQNDADCAGQVCRNERCRDECPLGSSQCLSSKSGQVCDNGACVPCAEDSDCDIGIPAVCDRHNECVPGGGGGLVLRGAEVAVTADESFGGAVVSVLWGGAEFVNRHDTGRLLQVAWNVDGENETLNPTEGGSINAKSTVFLYGSVTGKTLTTSCHPAYWLPPGYGGSRAQTVTTADKLTKAITADFGGNPHVLKYDTNIELAADTNLFSGEVPTIYLPREFNSFFTYDAETGALIDRTVDVNPAGGCIDPTQFDDLRPRHGGIVAATSNGGFALALYGSNPPNSGFGMPEGCYAFAACSFTHLSGAGPLGDATTKLVAKSRISQLAAGAHSWTSYVVVGSRDQVTATMSELWRNGN